MEGPTFSTSPAARTSGPGVVICRGLGGGEYAGPALLGAGPGPAAIAILDYDKDGLPDFAVADTSDAYVRLFRNRGGGEFDAPRIVYANSVPERHRERRLRW
jgi:hypothetical protein